jgi:hypothetical protein
MGEASPFPHTLMVFVCSKAVLISDDLIRLVLDVRG